MEGQGILAANNQISGFCLRMAKLLKYVEPVPAKNNKIYFYFRRHDKRTPLPGAYNSPEFLQAYWALRSDKAKSEINVERTLSTSKMSRADAQRPSCSAKTRRGGSQPTSPSCRSFYSTRLEEEAAL
jgi:hypothetical protein